MSHQIYSSKYLPVARYRAVFGRPFHSLNTRFLGHRSSQFPDHRHRFEGVVASECFRRVSEFPGIKRERLSPWFLPQSRARASRNASPQPARVLTEGVQGSCLLLLILTNSFGLARAPHAGDCGAWDATGLAGWPAVGPSAFGQKVRCWGETLRQQGRFSWRLGPGGRRSSPDACSSHPSSQAVSGAESTIGYFGPTILATVKMPDGTMSLQWRLP